MTEENYKLATEIKEQIEECEIWISILNGGYAVEAYTKKYLRKISKKEYEVIGIWTSRLPLQGFKLPRFMEKELLNIVIKKKAELKEQLEKL